MKGTIYIVFACCIAILVSCKKEDSKPGKDGMVKTIDCAMDEQIGLIPLDNGSFIMICNNQLVNIDDKGNVAWRKPISEIKSPLAAVAEPGSGFVLFGIPLNPPSPTSIYACRYLSNGNLLDKKPVNVNVITDALNSPVSVIRLANGGFAMAMSNNQFIVSYLKILDHEFNTVNSKSIMPPLLSLAQSQHICEMPNGDLALSIVFTTTTPDYSNIWINAAIYLTNPDGTIKSFSLMGDSVLNQIAHAVSTYDGGFFAASSTKTGWQSNTGSFVSYYSTGIQLAGTMQIDRFSSDGHYTGSRQLTGYEGYGIIKSIRKTSDGGYLLCGTAGNNGRSSSLSKTRVFVCKLDAGLNQVWSKTFETIYQVIGSDAIQTSDGGCLVTGNIKAFDQFNRMLLVKTDANGNY